MLTQRKHISSQERLFRDVFETLQVKRPLSKTADGTHKMETFPIPRVLYVMMYRKDAIFDGMPTKEDIVDDLPIDDEENIEEEVSEANVMEIDNFRNLRMRET